MSNIKIPVFGGCRLRDPFGFRRNGMMLALLMMMTMMMGNTYQISHVNASPNQPQTNCIRYAVEM